MTSQCHTHDMAVEVTDSRELEGLISSRDLVVVHFWAPWSQPCLQMNEVLEELAKEHENVKFVKVEAENFPEVSIKYEVVAVPTFILLKGGQVVDRVNGAHVPELTKKTALHSQTPLPPPQPPASDQTTKEDLDSRLKKLTNAAPCMLFMKGTPQEPRCGFSRQIVSLLDGMGVEYGSFNILADQEVRQGLKTFSNWPTYPQIYVNGELIGGLDIVKEMKESGELEEMLPKVKSLDDRLKSLTHQAPIMLFMKGSPEHPRCGFSRSICDVMKECKVEFSTFDILQDEEVRQGLKKFSNWPTYPQLYVKGELIGGLDIVKPMETDRLMRASFVPRLIDLKKSELKDSGELLETLSG